MKLTEHMVSALRSCHNGTAANRRALSSSVRALIKRKLVTDEWRLTTAGRALLKEWNTAATWGFNGRALLVLDDIFRSPVGRLYQTPTTPDDVAAFALLTRVQFIRHYTDAAGRNVFVLTRSGHDYTARGKL